MKLPLSFHLKAMNDLQACNNNNDSKGNHKVIMRLVKLTVEWTTDPSTIEAPAPIQLPASAA